MLHRVLVADADPGLVESLEVALSARGHEVLCAMEPAEALARARHFAPDLVLWGFEESPEAPGPASVVRHLPETCVVVIRDAPAGDAGRAPGESGPPHDDLLVRPVDQAELARVVARVGVQTRLRRSLILLERELRDDAGSAPVVGASSAMIELLEGLERAAGFDAPVLIQGERGTGKEGLARVLHAQSRRRAGPFVAVRCAHRDPQELGSELFGVVREGETTQRGRLVEAAGGVVFLDGVEGLPPELQGRLLEALQTESLAPEDGGKPWPLDVRLVAATALDLRAAVADGRFRRDLRERLAAVALRVPPLRDRREDIPLLLDHFVARSCRSLGRPLLGSGDEVLERLVAHTWPGNVRELRNVIERAVILATGERLTARDLPERLEAAASADDVDLGLRRARKRLEMELIRAALRRTGGNRTHAARLLEISHRALLYKIKEYGISD